MSRKAILAILVGLAAALACAAPAAAQLGPAVPIPDDMGTTSPEFIGERATPRPITGVRPVPEHPFMASNGRSNLHVDAYATDVNEWIGPLGGEMEKASNGQRAECASHTFDSKGRLITVCVGLAAPRLELMDPVTLDVLALMPLPPREAGGGNPFTEFGGGGYFYLDHQDRAVIPTTDRHVFVVETVETDSGPQFKQVDDYDLNPVLAEGDVIVSALPDFSGNIWFAARSGVVGFVDPADGSLHPLETGEGITNSFALDETGGVYVVTDRAMYRFDVGSDGEPTQSWREVYPNNGEMKPGQVDDGSGTTPSLMGSEFVAINDNTDPMSVIVYKRRKGVSGERQVCSQPVFPEGQSATDNSLIVTETSIVVENNFGYEGPQTTQGGGTTAPGIARIDLDQSPNGCSIVWESDVNSPTVVPKLSLANGLVYVYAKKPEVTDPWYLTAIDFRSGETVYQRLSGSGLGYNNNYAPLTVGPDGSMYIGVLDGIVRLADEGPAPGVGGGGGGSGGGDGGPGGDTGSCGDPVRGTGKSDRLVGDSGSDGFRGRGGNDTLLGRAGDDCLRCGAGADKIAGSKGRDAIDGGGGIDDIRGGPDRDGIRGGSGGDSIRGGGANDRLAGKDGRDVIRGGGGNDR
ncbi:MAG: hypothetical protein ACR2K6_03545, partial [Solirubrobacterales bacterium]